MAHIGISMPLDEDTSFASLPSSGSSTYGLMNDDHTTRHPHRARVLEKYMTRCKMLGILFAVVFVIGVIAAFIGANHQSTEVITTLALENKPQEVSLVPKTNSGIFIVKPKQTGTPATTPKEILAAAPHVPQEGALEHTLGTSKPQRVDATTVSASFNKGTESAMTHNQLPENVKKPAATPEDDNGSETPSDEPDVVYNPLANCTNPVKHPPKTLDFDDVKAKQFFPLETNPTGLLLAMRECPTFTYEHCKSHNTNKEVGFRATVHVRSLNQTYLGYGKQKKQAKKDAAYRVVLALYPEQHRALPESEMKSKILKSHCTTIVNTQP